MELSDAEVESRFTLIKQNYWQYDNKMSNFDLALLDERVTRAAASLLGWDVEEPPFDYQDLLSMIESEYLLDEQHAIDVLQIVEDRLYKRAN